MNSDKYWPLQCYWFVDEQTANLGLQQTNEQKGELPFLCSIQAKTVSEHANSSWVNLHPEKSNKSVKYAHYSVFKLEKKRYKCKLMFWLTHNRSKSVQHPTSCTSSSTSSLFILRIKAYFLTVIQSIMDILKSPCIISTCTTTSLRHKICPYAFYFIGDVWQRCWTCKYSVINSPKL